jgi:hypothetical protein
MYLYSKVRLIEIRCESEIMYLRLLVWALDAVVLLRRRDQQPDFHEKDDKAALHKIKSENENLGMQCSDESFAQLSENESACYRIMHNQRNGPDLVSIDELSRVVQAGYSLLSACKAIDSPVSTAPQEPAGFALVFDVAWAVALGLQQVLDSVVESLGLRSHQVILPSDDAVRGLEATSRVVDLKSLYLFARFMNYGMPIHAKVIDSCTSSVIIDCVQGSAATCHSSGSGAVSSIDAGPYISSRTGDEQVHCWCRYAQYGSMIGCDACEQWFHIGCMGLTRGKSKEIESFLCIRCCEARGVEYPYKWTSR